jgi:hypothetical protein
MQISETTENILIAMENSYNFFRPVAYPHEYATLFVIQNGRQFIPEQLFQLDKITPTEAERIIERWSLILGVDTKKLIMDIADASLIFNNIEKVPHNRR